MALIPDINEMRVNRIADAIRKDNELDDEVKSDLYMFLGELYGCMKLLDIMNKKEN